ncbi:MAG TPA: GWxTD domain-containing protein [Gemmatimonadales bacterium]|nr:GWxTD domain-containing protein [Gemmatimonadales bacterium]
MSGERGPYGGAAFVRAWLLALAVLLPLTAYCSPLTAQKTAFEQLHDSLATSSDTAFLRTKLRRILDGMETQAVPSAELRAGLVALRLGELRADPDFSDALSSFRRAARLLPARSEPWYGLGLSEAARSRWEMRDPLRLGNRVGLGALERSADYYARALDADPRFLPAALALAQVTMALLDTARLEQAQAALRRAAEAVPVRPPALLLALGRVERSAGELDSAAIHFERYLLTGGDRGLGLLELARTRLALGRADGDAPYYEGASLDDPKVVAEYRADLEILSGGDLREFDSLKGQARAAYLHRFWTQRDHWELRPEGERLREHYRRLLFARTHFPLTISRRFYGPLDAYRSGNTELDDRGIIYIRQGEPTDRLRPFVFGVMPNESWRYARAEGDLLFHFSAGYDRNGGGDLYDYRLVQSVLDLHGAVDAPRDQLLLSRQSLSPMYARMLNWGRFGSVNEGARERNIGKTSIEVGTTTDSYELRFNRRLAAVADLISVGRSAGGSLAHLVFGIAAPGTSPRRVAAGVEYAVRVRLVALGAGDRSVATLDTTIIIALSGPLTRKGYLVGRAQLTLPVGHWRYRAALQQGDSVGVVLPLGTVRVAATDGTALSLSDIALGTPGRSVSWVTDAADTVLLAPSELFRKGAEIEIYYEASGAAPLERYRHEISVLPWNARGSKRRPLVSLSFEEGAAGKVIRSRRTVRLERLKPGNYIVEVKVVAPDGSFQVRQRAIRLIQP